MRSLHIQLHRTRSDDTGHHSQAIGARIGYWPCLLAPFIQLALGSYRLDVWYGLPSYRTPGGS